MFGQNFYSVRVYESQVSNGVLTLASKLGLSGKGYFLVVYLVKQTTDGPSSLSLVALKRKARLGLGLLGLG